jgi:hypothetical protein
VIRAVASIGRHALLACALWMLLALGVGGEARAQGACDSQEVKGYVASVRWPRPAQPPRPPKAWTACIDSLPDGLRKSVLRNAELLRSESDLLRANPTSAEAWLLKGSDRQKITPDLIDGWRAQLAPPSDERFRSVYYQSFLGALALTVLDRSRGLERLGVAPVAKLQDALRGAPDWPRVEDTLKSFRHIRLWGGGDPRDPTLTEMRDIGLKVTPEMLAATPGRAAVEQIRSRPLDNVYAPRVAGAIRGIPAAQVDDTTAPRPAWAAKAPGGCASDLCKAVERCASERTPEAWTALQGRFAGDLRAVRGELGKIRVDLPAIPRDPLEGRIEIAQRAGDRLVSSKGYDIPGSDVERAVGLLNDLSATIRRLQGPAAYSRALRHLLGGDAPRARKSIEAVKSWTKEPRLAAAYVAAAYAEGGPEGARDVCTRNALACDGSSLAPSLAEVEGILGIGQGTLRTR